jgi:pimeloyl-ACP methyl ester carboxylesterase
LKDGRDRFFIGAEGNRLAATERGDGDPPVLLLHGGGQTRHAFSNAARRLASHDFRAITLDQRGHGDSDRSEPGAYAFADFASDLISVAEKVRQEAARPPVVVGASLGGICALMAIRRRPALFSGLVLVDVTPRLETEGVAKVQGFMIARAKDGFATVEEAAEAIAAYLPHRPRPKSLEGLSKNLRLHEDGRLRWHWDPRFLDGPRRVDSAGREAIERELEDAARGLAIPTLLVRGGASELVSDECVREFLAMAPHAETVDVGGAHHMVAGDRNDAFNDAMVDFLDRRFGAAVRPAAP